MCARIVLSFLEGTCFRITLGCFLRLYAFSPLVLLLPSFSPFPFNTVQSLSRVRFFTTTLTAARQASLSFTVSWSLLRLTSIESVMPSSHLVLCHLLLLLPSIFPSIRVFFSELALPIRWPKYWSLSFSISSSNEYSELISFRIDWFDILVVQGILTSLLQPHSLKASILRLQLILRMWGDENLLSEKLFSGTAQFIFLIFLLYCQQ